MAWSCDYGAIAGGTFHGILSEFLSAFHV
jgi:hypothetical protein